MVVGELRFRLNLNGIFRGTRGLSTLLAFPPRNHHLPISGHLVECTTGIIHLVFCDPVRGFPCKIGITAIRTVLYLGQGSFAMTTINRRVNQ